MTTTLSRLARRLLPVGRPLPEEDWTRRHRGILIFLWFHAAALPAFALYRGLTPGHAVFEGLAIAVPAMLATPARLSREIRMVMATIGLVASSAVLVHVSGGVIEMHFHYFVVVAIITLYQSWRPFLLAVAFVLFQHGLVGVIDPATVFNHPAAIANPWRWASIHAAFIAAESGACLTAWRVSEGERARADEFDRQLATLVQFSDDAIAGLDTRGRVGSWNPAAERLFGYPAAEAMGRPITMLVPPDLAEDARAFFARVVGGESVRDYEAFGLAKDGTRIPLSVTASPITDSNGHVLGISLIARDITRHKEAEEQLAAARDEALKLSRLKSEFLANMSHEIRTPMNGVLGMTGLLLATDLDPDQREYAETVRRSGDALLTIIDEILDFSRIEAGKARLQTTDFDIRSVVEDVAVLLGPLAEEKGLDLVRLVHPGVPKRANGDPGRLRQVLTNLLGNAIRFTPSGEVVVRVRTEEGGGADTRLRFDITDTGVGIPLEAQGRLFESFYQVDSSSTRSAGGTGLGLAISRELVQLMGGEIGVQSQPGAGSTFWFTIQVQPPLAPAEPPSAGTELTGRRALVVAADLGLAHTLRRLVEGAGMRADVAASPEQALARLREQAPARDGYAVVVADADLPGSGGIELARLLTLHRSTSAVPLFLVTFRGRQGEAEAARRAGVSGYLTAPVTVSQLLEGIAAVTAAAGTPEGSAFVTRHSLKEAHATTRPHVLVADDNLVNQRVAMLMLERLGCRVDVAGDGAEAVAAVAKNTYAAVVMDCHMPRMDGYEATKTIRAAEGDRRRTPIIAMTASAMEEDEQRCLDIGMDGYIAKPFREEDLLAALAPWMPGTAPAPSSTTGA